MRADALQRRQALLTQARRLFAEIGRDVSLDSIAAASSVGIATLYRNFSSREELINAVTLDVVTDLDNTLARFRNTPVSPHLAWKRFIFELSELNLGALTEVLSGSGATTLTEPVAAAQHAALEQLTTELQRQITAEVVRSDLTAPSLVAAIAVITRPQSAAIRDAVPELREQLLDAYLQWSWASRDER